MIEWVHGGDNMTVGENIKTIRKQQKVTQKKLHELTGLAVITIQEYEAGKYTPRLDSILKIASALKVNPKDINPDLNWDDYIDTERIASDVKFLESNPSLQDILEAIYHEYGDFVTTTIQDFFLLNDDGKQKVSEYIQDLIPKYKKK